MKTLRAIWRLFAFCAALTWYATPLWIRAALGPIDWHHHQAVRQRFCKTALRILGIELSVEGEPYVQGPCVYASNHRSWLDPFVELAVVWAFPVAKAEVGKLPFVAPGARATGILFVDRGDRSSRQAIMDEMEGALQRGHSILIYPEGTTSTLPGTRAFRRGAFAVAEAAQVACVPLTMLYPSPDYYWGEGESLWDNFVQVAGEKRTEIKLHIGQALQAEVSEAQMQEAQAYIDAVIMAHTAGAELPTGLAALT